MNPTWNRRIYVINTVMHTRMKTMTKPKRRMNRTITYEDESENEPIEPVIASYWSHAAAMAREVLYAKGFKLSTLLAIATRYHLYGTYCAL